MSVYPLTTDSAGGRAFVPKNTCVWPIPSGLVFEIVGPFLVPFLLSNFQFLLSIGGAREKHSWRNVESFAQLLNVGSIEITLSVQDFGHDAFRAKDGDQIFLAEIIGIYQRAKDFHRARIGNGMMLFFVGFD